MGYTVRKVCTSISVRSKRRNRQWSSPHHLLCDWRLRVMIWQVDISCTLPKDNCALLGGALSDASGQLGLRVCARLGLGATLVPLDHGGGGELPNRGPWHMMGFSWGRGWLWWWLDHEALHGGRGFTMRGVQYTGEGLHRATASTMQFNFTTLPLVYFSCMVNITALGDITRNWLSHINGATPQQCYAPFSGHLVPTFVYGKSAWGFDETSPRYHAHFQFIWRCMCYRRCSIFVGDNRLTTEGQEAEKRSLSHRIFDHNRNIKGSFCVWMATFDPRGEDTLFWLLNARHKVTKPKEIHLTLGDNRLFEIIACVQPGDPDRPRCRACFKLKNRGPDHILCYSIVPSRALLSSTIFKPHSTVDLSPPPPWW